MDLRKFFGEALDIFYVWKFNAASRKNELLSLRIDHMTVRQSGMIEDSFIIHHIAGVSEKEIASIEVPAPRKGDVWNSPTLVEPHQFDTFQRHSAYKRLLTFSIRYLPVLRMSDLTFAMQRGIGTLPIRNLLMNATTPPIVQSKIKDALHQKLNISIDRINRRDSVQQLALQPTEKKSI